MLLDKVFAPFLKATPICVMAQATLTHLFNPAAIDALFARVAQRQYTHQLLFSSLVELMGQVVLRQQPSVHAAYRQAEAVLPVSDQAVYNKLQCVELAVSAALVHDAAQRVAPVIDALDARLPALLPGYHVRILDGNHLAATEHRLKELRFSWAAPLPGTVLAVLDQERMTVTDVIPLEDAHAQERSVLDQVLAVVRQKDVWVADRNFCTLNFLLGILNRGGFFVIRQHGQLQGELLGKRVCRGHTDTGMVYEQHVRFRTDDGKVLKVRRITVVLDTPTQDGDTELHLLTNLSAKKVSAAKVAEVYRKRWTIEGVFFEASQTLSCEIDTLCYPKAALFAFCLGLVACNAVALLKAALRAVHGAERITTEVSAYYLALEIQQTHRGMMVALPLALWERFATLTAKGMAAVLREMAGHVQLERYRKTTRGPKKPPPKRTKYKNGEHVATFRVIADRKKA